MKTLIQKYKLDEVASLNPKPTFPLGKEVAVSFVSMANVSAETGMVNIEKKSYLEVSKGYTPFMNGDILVAKITPCFENGKIARATLKHDLGFGSSEFHVIRPNPNKIEARYLLHFLRQPQVRLDGAKKMTGSAGQKRVPIHFFANLEIYLPPLEEQKRIVEILDRAEELRSKRRQAIALLGTLTQSVFLEMFGDPIKNIKGWPIEKLGNIGTLDRGISKHRPRNAPELLGGIYPLVQTGDVANSGGYIRNYQSTYSELGLRQSKMWKAGTLCITIAANIAKTGILTFDACFPDSIVGFVASDYATIEFVRVWLSFLQKTLEETAPESAQKNINLATLRNLNIPFPPIQLQKDFSLRVQSLEKLKISHRKALSELEALFFSLQYRAFRGEL